MYENNKNIFWTKSLIYAQKQKSKKLDLSLFPLSLSSKQTSQEKVIV